ncbi:serine hydrolase domain-containing protein [Rhodococcus sp. HNM0569]|uniref:serine hydrolase n=1 Tax=Rhodococcus sp. HNM0569 TaxID=2716340 RepID=UPI00146F8DEE|nr:beta-lactamase family protein [Rhodococcus sp. HNM0569]
MSTALGGTYAPRFAPVADLLERNLADGTDLGASVCVVHDGEVVVDLWGGMQDGAGRSWQRDTLVNVYSLSKTATAMAALALVDRGLLDLDAPVARYWPEFGAAGKQGVLVRHVLSHTSGVAGWRERVSVDDVCDVPASSALLAAQEPWWEPGTASGYHALNYGHLVDALVRRVDGRALGAWFADEIAHSLGADFHLGVGPDEDDRIAPLVAPPPTGFDYGALDPESVFVKTMTNPLVPIPVTSSRQWRAAGIGAAGGHGNARSVAAVNTPVSHAGMGLGGVRVLSAETVERVFEPHSDGVDAVLGAPVRFGPGFALGGGRLHPSIPQQRACWWTGYGGSIVVNDADRRLTFAYVMNRMEPELLGSPRTDGYVSAVYDSLGDRVTASVGAAD